MRLEPLDTGAPVVAEFVAVGHVTLDETPGGGARPGGTALYSALLASRAGLRATIVTAGDPATLDAHLREVPDPVTVLIAPGAATTRLLTAGAGSERRQRVAALAPPVPLVAVAAQVLHLGPIAGELSPEWLASGGAFVGLTPQGALRHQRPDGSLELGPNPDLARHRADAVVYSEGEAAAYAASAPPRRPDQVVVVTASDQPARIHAGGAVTPCPGFPAEEVDDMGAGDVFAAALFIALAEGAGPLGATRFAHAAAALRIAHAGLAGIPGRDAVERLAATAG